MGLTRRHLAGAVASALAATTTACGNETVLIAPVVDGPSNDATASVFPDVNELVVSVAHAGSADDLTSATFTRGQTIELDGVPFADDLVIHMDGKVDGADIAYGRTCMFAVAEGDPPPTPHLFFSRTVKFASLPFVPELRLGGAGYTYHDGSGLLIGGVDGNGSAISDVERLDPNDGTFTLTTQIAPRFDAVVSTLGASDGQVAIIGGQDGNSVGSPLVELIELDNPPAQRVDQLPENTMLARVELTATAVPDGRVIAIGGRMPGGAPTGEIDELTDTGGDIEIDPLHAVLVQPRTQHTATLLDDDDGAGVLIAGGLDATGAPVATAELFESLGNVLASPTTFAPAMIVPRYRHQALLMPDKSVLVLGGLDGNDQPVTTIELWSFETGFVDVGQLPAGIGIVDTAATTLPDGRILITGGRANDGGDALDTAFIASLDPVDGTVDVVPTDNLAAARAGHQATLLCDGTVLVSGGVSTAIAAERYNPPATGRR